MLAVVRIRGITGIRKELEDTLKMLGLKRKHTLVVLPRTDAILGMVKKVNAMITWGELDQELQAKFEKEKKTALKSPRKGFRAIKRPYPKGDLGYRGKEINELIKRMM